MKKGDSVKFRGGVDRFFVYEAQDDDILLEHPATGRLFSVDYRALSYAHPTFEGMWKCFFKHNWGPLNAITYSCRQYKICQRCGEHKFIGKDYPSRGGFSL